MKRGRPLSRRALLASGVAGGVGFLAGCNARPDEDDLRAAEVTPATVPQSGRERLFAIYGADLPPYDPPTLVSDDHLRSRFDRLGSLVETVEDTLAATETPENGTTAERTDTATATERTSTTVTETTNEGTTNEGTTNEGTTNDSGGRPGGRNPPRSDVRADARRLVSDASGLLDRAEGPPQRWELPDDGAVSGRLLAIRGANHYVRALTKRWWWLRVAANQADPSALPEPADVLERVESVERSRAYRCSGTGVALPFYARSEDAVGEAAVILGVWQNALEAARDGETEPDLGERAFYAVGAELALADAEAYQETLRNRAAASWPCGPTIERTYRAVRPRLESKVARFESLLADGRGGSHDRAGGDGTGDGDDGVGDDGDGDGDDNARPSETTAFGHARAELLRQSPANSGQLARTDELLATGDAASALTRLATLLVRSRGIEVAIDALPSESIEAEALRHRAADAREGAATRIETTTGRIDRENLFARALVGEAVEAVERGDEAVAYTVEQRTVTDDGRTELAEAVAQYSLATGIADSAPAVARLAQPARD